MKSSVLLLALRHLRGPLIALVAVFSTGIAGLVALPGIHDSGEIWHMTFAQALYFMSYTATTIGFGEIPAEFTDAQRLWVTAIIFASVIGWAYLVGTFLALGRDEAFQGALRISRFARAMRALRQPFYLICGFGETGLLVGRALDRLGIRFAVVDIDSARVQEVKLLDLGQEVPALCADARLPDTLLQAGLAASHCLGVLALTSDDQANLAVAMSVRLMNPETPVLARAMSREVEVNMASFNTNHVINPFARFGDYLALALAAPKTYRLISWLTALPGTPFRLHLAPPRGRWVVCGYGRFGREVVAALRDQGLDACIVDPAESPVQGLDNIRGRGTEAEPLVNAGIHESVGIVAGTDDDIANLSIAVTARELNENLFTVVRQNLQSSGPLLAAYGADITMVSSDIIAHECVAIIKTPRLADFLAFARGQQEHWVERVLERLDAVMDDQVPEIWSVRLSADEAPALLHAMENDGLSVTVGDLLRNPTNREERLAILPLNRTRKGTFSTLPEPTDELRPGDEVLFAGTMLSQRAQLDLLNNLNVCCFAITGQETPSGWIWQAIKRGTRGPAHGPA